MMFEEYKKIDDLENAYEIELKRIIGKYKILMI